MRTSITVASGLLGVLGAATVGTAPPAAAAEPHDLSRTDTYHGFYRQTPYTCTQTGSNILEADGDGFVSASTDCTQLTVYLTVSYVDETGRPVTFTTFSEGHVAAEVHDVGSDLAISYYGTQLAGPSFPEYKLPK
jgi:hypothetical protein